MTIIISFEKYCDILRLMAGCVTGIVSMTHPVRPYTLTRLVDEISTTNLRLSILDILPYRDMTSVTFWTLPPDIIQLLDALCTINDIGLGCYWNAQFNKAEHQFELTLPE